MSDIDLLIRNAEEEYKLISNNCSLPEIITKLELMYSVAMFDAKTQNKDYKTILGNTKTNIENYLRIIDTHYDTCKTITT